MPTADGREPGPDGRSRRFAQGLFSPLPRRYDRLAEVLSFGQNARWRREMVDHAIAGSPGLILDVATGPGGVARQLARRTRARVVGIDVTKAMLDHASRTLRDEALADRVTLVRGTAEQLPFPDNTFEALTFTYLLRYVADPEAVIREMVRVVRPGGAVASLEFCVPPVPYWQAAWWLYTRAVLPAAGALTGGKEWFDVGRFLGPSISRHYRRYTVEWTERAWSQAGLDDVRSRQMSLGGGLVMWGRKVDV
ncbi:MAG: class I SAM-dependent methyltransferase [Acidimicrobiales bacterium]